MTGLYMTCRSRFTGKPIVVVWTCLERKSGNPKTGDMWQMWIIPAVTDPVEAVEIGSDEDVCGSCTLRWFLDGWCYVLIQKAPQTIWQTLLDGGYEQLDLESQEHKDLLARKLGRWGAYGDPMALPRELWEFLGSLTPNTGYTHAWKQYPGSVLKRWCMASCDTEEDSLLARHYGWLPFRVRKEGEPIGELEFECPASEEQGHRLTCEECMACGGTRGLPVSRRASPVINLHGRRKGRA